MQPLRPDDPRSIGPYRIVSRLGVGGMGQVYLARSRAGREVALKLVHLGLAGDPEFRTRFRREVTAARAVGGAFTAPVIDADLDAPVPWLATVYLHGLSLQRAVTEHGPLPLDSVFALGAGLAEALEAIHRAGVVHRDLTPSNVILTPDGPKVIDFGIARGAGAGTLTASGSVLGSPGFMAPEQATGRVETGAATDVFAFGAVLVYALTGVGPFGRGAIEALIYRIVHEEPRLDGVADPDLRDLVAACLVKEPEFRPTPGLILERLSPYIPQPEILQGTSWLPADLGASVTRRLDPPPAAPPDVPATRRLEKPYAPPAPHPVPAVTRPKPGLRASDQQDLSRRRILRHGRTGLVVAIIGGVGALMAFPPKSSPSPPPRSNDRPLLSDLQMKLKPTPVNVPNGIRWRTPMSYGTDERKLAVVGKAVFIAAPGGRVHVLDAGTGKKRWSAPYELAYTGGGLVPVVKDGTVYLRDRYSVSAYDLATGESGWKREVESQVQQHPPVVAKGMVVVQGKRNLAAYDAARGTPRWTHEGDGRYEGSFTFAGDLVYAGFTSDTTEIKAIEIATGRVRWTSTLTDQFGVACVALRKSGGSLYARLGDGTIHALDADSGRRRWSSAVRVRQREVTGSLVLAEGAVYSVDESGDLHAFDARTGKLRWRRPLDPFGEDVGPSLSDLTPVPAGKLLYMHDSSRTLLAVETATGKVRWRREVEWVNFTDSVVVAAGAVHVAVTQAVCSFDMKSGRLLREESLSFPEGLLATGNALYVTDTDSVLSLRMP
ncbi:serine/threonine-protein kinase [Nonomuraea jiangxiensis]|uniref:Serine/threonine protein kinase n=1 Tax=Nonomuraea jiangxiensis TaxID=633440 RepID=A0A1G9C495_9ACTN|nr:serine/threonine-protein kinase [Nonomuraea jiangxiensis]SDK46507.1 Serine/threonine protein kinase [Nonomuraea jiangxiensis]